MGTQDQRGQEICLRSHSKGVARLGLEKLYHFLLSNTHARRCVEHFLSASLMLITICILQMHKVRLFPRPNSKT